MEKQRERRLQRTAVFLFLIYMILLVYFLFFSESYGRTMKEQEYRYNLQLFQEIRRFWTYRQTLGWKSVCVNLFGNIAAFMPFGFFLPIVLKKLRTFALYHLVGAVQLFCGGAAALF